MVNKKTKVVNMTKDEAWSLDTPDALNKLASKDLFDVNTQKKFKK